MKPNSLLTRTLLTKRIFSTAGTLQDFKISSTSTAVAVANAVAAVVGSVVHVHYFP